MSPARPIPPAAFLSRGAAPTPPLKAIATALLLGVLSGEACAQPPQAPPAARKPAARDFAEGEVRKVDRAAGAIILRHGQIKSLNMAPMTMAFVARPPALLDGIVAGDRVRFTAEEVDGEYFVTAIEKAK